MSQFPVDCLDEIFEYLNDDRSTLHSCILVNRLWCGVSVRIFWRNSRNYNISNLKTLISCLPNKSKEILSNNGIIILTSITNFPAFNYASFCKVLSIKRVQRKTKELLKNQQIILPRILNNSTNIVLQEICKMFINQISSLKRLDLPQHNYAMPIPNFAIYPEAKDCLKNLSELYCSSSISTETFYQLLSQICHNISLINIKNDGYYRISDGLADLISVQKNLKHFTLLQHDTSHYQDYSFLVRKLPNTLIKLNLISKRNHRSMSLSFIAKFSNLQELKLLFDESDFIDFDKLSDISFPQLQILKFQHIRPNNEALARFLENNGKNLKELYVGVSRDSSYSNNLLNSSISKFCTNLRKFSAGFKNDELEMLKIILKSCQYLKSIEIYYGGKLLSEKEVLREVVSYENISEIILNYWWSNAQSVKLLPEELESFIVNRANYIPQKLLSFVIVTDDYKKSLDKNEENIKIIKKYIGLGVIKSFKIKGYDYDGESNQN
ncbi:hypothetical protein RclHR1_01110027 [Rhizophagus clarus]|uniref:F-box domain-containing protein n=1 Tax=Rhizophagus clarus TaxID=94130 RepID=A0A2Z6Q814_9GLOM|nr:hypothetical protein RclHR1_01110027 [Rhizophagus clarus]GES74566.1 hypothetical protein GLOIN_2v1876445 [Rhizophagus clarus]